MLPTRPESRSWNGLSALLDDDGFDMIEAAMWIAATEDSELDVLRESARVRFIAGEGARRVAGLDNPFAIVDGISEFLFEDLGFRGNVLRYKDPRNSFLHEVLNRRLGIPLTLSMIYLEVAREAGLTAHGVGLPGHFVVRVDLAGRTILVDPFHGGKVITEDDCADLVTRTTGRAGLFRREMLEGTTERAMLTRLLLNLKHVYVQQQDYGRALAMVDRLLLVQPEDWSELRDRGLIQAHLGRPGAAIRDLEQYLQVAPAPDEETVRARVAWLRRQMTEMN